MTNYKLMSRPEAMDRLENHNEADEETLKELRREGRIINPVDVLYYLDAFGDIHTAVNLQPLPKDLPDRVLKKIDEWDVLEGWNGDVKTHECPTCTRTLYEFDFRYNYYYIDRKSVV